jgi:hypothetical protein
MPLLILQAVRHLHEQGIGSLRIFPGMNASGTAWRITIFSAGADTDELSYPEPEDEAACVRYSSADGNEFTGVHLGHDADATLVAALILVNLPDLLPADSDAQYLQWYRSMMEQVRSVEDVPVAYADYFDDGKGWELGWGSGRYYPAPPSLI